MNLNLYLFSKNAIPSSTLLKTRALFRDMADETKSQQCCNSNNHILSFLLSTQRDVFSNDVFSHMRIRNRDYFMIG